MTVETEKVTHIHKELASLSKTAFEYKKLLLLKSPQNKAASTSATTEKKKNRHYIPSGSILTEIYGFYRWNSKILH